MFIDQSLVTLVSASTALIASIAGPFVTLRVGRQQFKANVLSVNRQRWIEMMRDVVSDLVSQLQVAASLRQTLEGFKVASFVSDPALLKRVEDLSRTIAKVDLLLNPLEKDHQRLREVMVESLSWLRSEALKPDLMDSMDATTAEIIRISQQILKREWIRVKRGS